MLNLDVDLLRAFVAVADTGGFTSAASALNITTSAASKQVKSLEERLGARLFNRTTRHVSLTEVGRAFRDRIEPVLAEVEEAEQGQTFSQKCCQDSLLLSFRFVYNPSNSKSIPWFTVSGFFK